MSHWVRTGLAAAAGFLLSPTAVVAASHASHVSATSHRDRPSLQVLLSFSGADGAEPAAGVIVDKTGALFGTTQAGGKKNLGTAYTLEPSSSGYVETLLHVFAGGSADGAQPVAPLTEDASGNLWGTTVGGGYQSSKRSCAGGQIAGCGTLFELTPSTSGYSEHVYRFGGGASQGYSPYSGVVLTAQGGIEGTTMWGDGGVGTVYTLTSKKIRVNYAFPIDPNVPNYPDGALPLGAVALDQKGTFYGSAPFGGTVACPLNLQAQCGVVFAVTNTGGIYGHVTLYSFAGGNDGWYPEGGVVLDRSGALYGTTEFGGSANQGVVFKLTPAGSGYAESVIYSFQGGEDGALPVGGVIVDHHGALYGTTSSGGSANAGTIFKLTPSGSSYSERVLYAFTGGTDGAQPVAPLAFGKSGVVYGTTLAGGAYAGGTVFAFHS